MNAEEDNVSIIGANEENARISPSAAQSTVNQQVMDTITAQMQQNVQMMSILQQ